MAINRKRVLPLLLVLPFLFGATSTFGPGKDYATIQGCINARTAAGDICDGYTADYSGEGRIVSAASGSNGTTGLITIQCHAGETCSISSITISHNYNKVSGLNIFQPGALGTEGLRLTGSNNQATGNVFSGGYAGNPGSYQVGLVGNSNTFSGNTISGPALASGGQHTGSNGAATLTDSTKSWATNALIGLGLYNETQDKRCDVTANTSTTLTCTLSGGANWNTNDFYVAGSTTFIGFYVTGNSNVISGNTVRNLVDVERVYEIYGTGNTVSGDEIYNITGTGYSGVHADLFQTTTGGVSVGTIIEKLYAHDIYAQLFNLETDAGTSSYGWIIRNNIFANVHYGNSSSYIPLTLYNNTFYDCGQEGGNIFSLYKHETLGDASNSLIKNNALIGTSTGDATGLWGTSGSPTGIANNNNYVGKLDYSTRTYSETGAVNGGDPKFIAPYTDCVANTCNFNIASDSPLKDVGADLSGVWASATDKDGVSRPQGAAWDIGAYEYASGEADTTAPSVSITTSDPSAITADSLEVTGTASDAVGVSSCKFRIGSAPDADNGTACTGTTSWTCNTSGYSIGANTLYVGCGDAAGNWGSDSITVNYNRVKPIITLGAGPVWTLQ